MKTNNIFKNEGGGVHAFHKWLSRNHISCYGIRPFQTTLQNRRNCSGSGSFSALFVLSRVFFLWLPCLRHRWYLAANEMVFEYSVIIACHSAFIILFPLPPFLRLTILWSNAEIWFQPNSIFSIIQSVKINIIDRVYFTAAVLFSEFLNSILRKINEYLVFVF